jgi:hypothetical protein
VTSGSPDTLSRTTVYSSSNNNNLVTFSAGIKDVFTTPNVSIHYPLIVSGTAIIWRNQTIGGSTAGGTRGAYAVDLQGERNNSNQVASGDYSVICGGARNRATNDFAVCLGGFANLASGKHSVAAGNGSTASGDYTFVHGSSSSTASGNYSFACGNNAVASGLHSFAVGTNVTASGNYSMAQGSGVTASGLHSIVLGSNTCTASAPYSMILASNNALANKYGQIARASGQFSSAGDAQHSDFILRTVTSNATPTELFLDGSSEVLTIDSGSLWAFDILVCARRVGTDQNAAYHFYGAVTSSGILGTPVKTVVYEDNSAWDFSVDFTSGRLRLQATGAASTTIRWVANVKTVEVKT